MESQRRVVAGAVLLVLSVQYFAAEMYAAAAWDDPRYSWTRNYISTLGTSACGPDVCSPHHAVGNASLVVHAGVVLVATALLSPLVAPRICRWAARALVVVHASGSLIVAAAPVRIDGGSNDLHYFGAALVIIGGFSAIIVVGIASLLDPHRRAFGAFSVAAGALSLVGLVVLRWNSTQDAGLPDGLLERTAVDPIIGWGVLTGVVLLVATALGHQRREGAGRPGVQ